ncbi:hypothetical protein A2U01_0112665, partial [Trifolium medium]|nr:hypothetical protein [Trifolium medium]
RRVSEAGGELAFDERERGVRIVEGTSRDVHDVCIIETRGRS